MKVNHFIFTIDITSGGPARSVTHLIESLLARDSELEIRLDTLESQKPILYKYKSNKGSIKFHSFGRLEYSKSLQKSLQILDANLFHGHGLWQMPVHQMSKVAREREIPYIITPRGMLETWSLNQGKIKKQLALKLYQYKDLEKASCIHATSLMEVESIRHLGFKNPIAMIPNGVNISEYSVTIPENNINPKKILFLSRIHVKKGIENLIEAWSLIAKDIRKDWVVEIVGNGEENYIQSLKEKIAKENLASQIRIIPPVFGLAKVTLFRESSLFVLPTYSENFGVVIAEALASYTPVITTKGAPWEELETHDCGWWIEIGVLPLKEALLKALETNESELIKMSKRGRNLIEEKYSMESVAERMLTLYNWILTKENKPNFIDFYE